MGKVKALLFIVVIALSICGCITGASPSATPAPTSAPAPTPLIYIGGAVIDPRGAPVYDARVALWQGDHLVDAPGSIQYTDEKGLFNFTNLTPAHYQITADIQGHQGTVDRRFNDSTTSIEIIIPDYTVPSVTVIASQIPANMPHFEVVRTGPTTVEVRLTSFGGATGIRGFYVKSPYITTPELVAVDKPLGESWSAMITDPNLRAPAHLIASSWVNGNYAEVINTTI
ncbi:MAG TPA: hypothetical protein VMC84_04045 [Methanocella sp.]|uniref:carboxypeptidase-like regulatory domain-containing protein n=1 Tax=Methanocella sp. TaxID=2052833 RepID=UPI002D1CB789|nr:hypothetical protein [Methanocella sp.]HTY90326.1 hypothetical protein [Methanocella sp.]